MRGKEALSAANRRTLAAVERADGLEVQLRDRESAWALERDQLRREVQVLRTQLSREVRSIARDAIDTARQDCAAAIETARAGHLGQVLAGLDAIDRNTPGGFGLESHESYTDVAEAFGIEVGSWLGHHMPDVGREARRTTNGSSRVKAGHIAAIRSQGKRAVPEARAFLEGLDRQAEEN